MREPLRWSLQLGERAAAAAVAARFARAARGPADDAWDPPPWLLPHQRDAARRLAGSLAAFGGAICADAVGLGKTYVGLALATRYRRVCALVPAALVGQWRGIAAGLGIGLPLVSHESLSRGAAATPASLTIVDEAHRFRNPATRRYRALLAGLGGGHVLLLTATPVVNTGADLLALLRLFLPDRALAILGMPSLEGAGAGRQYSGLARAAAALTVARSHDVVAATAGPLPLARDSRVIRAPPLSPSVLPLLVRGLRALRYPTFADRSAASLLALHLQYRLASSLDAGRETLRRHLAWLDRAIAAGRRGESPSRAALARLLRDEWDDQFELDLLEAVGTARNVAGMRAERKRIVRLLALVTGSAGDPPKFTRLRDILAAREGRKTIVFTTAIATARALARGLGWRRVAVVSGGGAWIASGRLPVEEALSLFAPQARRRAPAAPATAVQTLIATDLASEGLNLQDADAIVHYDLPWTPLRLAQRLGRVARLGSSHRVVAVWWFAPPAELGGDDLVTRILRKGAVQVACGVPLSSTVGRARVAAATPAWRERLAARDGSDGRSPAFAVVRGPRAAACVLAWRKGHLTVPEIVLLEGPPWRPVADGDRAGLLLGRLLGSEAVDTLPPSPLDALAALVRGRLADTDRPRLTGEEARLARAVARRAGLAGHRRNERLLAALDGALARLQDGIALGRVTSLAGTLAGPHPQPGLERWLRAAPVAAPVPWCVALTAALLGDGTTPS